jgi:hypothetical protein
LFPGLEAIRVERFGLASWWFFFIRGNNESQKTTANFYGECYFLVCFWMMHPPVDGWLWHDRQRLKSIIDIGLNTTEAGISTLNKFKPGKDFRLGRIKRLK